jgi:hypothetical protein
MLSKPNLPPEQEERLRCVALLKSLECHCGRRKSRGMSFCMRCFHLLPLDLRRALYRKIGDGYEAAYREACARLAKAGLGPRFLCKMNCWMEGFEDGPRQFTAGKTYTALRSEPENGFVVFDDEGGEHWIGAPGDDFFSQFFEVAQ